MILVVIGHFLLGFILASLLNTEFKGRTVFRVIFMLPWLFPESVIALLFTWILNPMYGVLNAILKSLGQYVLVKFGKPCVPDDRICLYLEGISACYDDDFIRFAECFKRPV